MSAFGNLSRSRAILLAVIVIGGAALFWGRGFIGLADGQSGGKEHVCLDRTRSSLRQPTNRPSTFRKSRAESIKVGPIEARDFAVFKTAVGTIDFNQNMLVQVFSQYRAGLKAIYNVGDKVKKGDTLFTIDSPDLLQAESTLLAAAGVLELRRGHWRARSTP